ncbi:MAG: hypothetical protein ACOH17_14240 [Cellulomonas sp.]
MASLLLTLTFNASPEILPDMRDIGHTILARLGNALHEHSKGDPAKWATAVDDIPAADWAFKLGAQAAAAKLRYRSVRTYSDALAEARSWGAIVSAYEKNPLTAAWNLHPTNTLVNLVDGHVTFEATRRAAVAYLTTLSEFPPVHVVGVGRASENIDETVHPQSPDDAVDALVRRGAARFVGTVGRDLYDWWTPNGDQAAGLLAGDVADYVGVAMPPVRVPVVRFRGPRPVLTDDVRGLLPEAFHSYCAKPRDEAAAATVVRSIGEAPARRAAAVRGPADEPASVRVARLRAELAAEDGPQAVAS